MKKFLLLLLIPFFVSCSKDDDKEPEKNTIKETIEREGIYPSDIDKINQIKVVDSVNYKFAIGRRNNNAWISKFNSNGEELFSFEIKNQDTEYKFSTFYSLFKVDNKKILTFAFKTKDETDVLQADNIFELYIIDFNTGIQINKIPQSANYSIFSYKEYENRAIIVEKSNNISKMYCLDGNYVTSWERFFKDGENFDLYENMKFIDNEVVIFPRYDYEYPLEFNAINKTDQYKCINLKKYELIKNISVESFENIGERKNENGIVYRTGDLSIIEDLVRITIKEMEESKDPISGTFSYKLLDIYFYDLDNVNFKIVNSGKMK